MKFIKKIICFFHIQNYLLIQFLKTHNYLYELITKLAILNNNGLHPKHDITQYENWFLNLLNTNSILLNIGSHRGEFEKLASPRVSYVYGIEIVEELVLSSRSLNISNAEFYHANANDFNYEKLKEVDAVILSNVLEHIEERETLLKNLIKNVKFKDGPRFLIRVPVLDRDWIPVLKKKLNIEYRLDPTHVVELTSEEWICEFKKLGLTPCSVKFTFGEIWGDFRFY